jgi:hypothetical protein
MLVCPQVIEDLRQFPIHREVEHCGQKFQVSPFDIYATCPQCGCQIKVRSFSATFEVEDLFDAIFEWLQQPVVQEYVRRRQAVLATKRDN